MLFKARNNWTMYWINISDWALYHWSYHESEGTYVCTIREQCKIIYVSMPSWQEKLEKRQKALDTGLISYSDGSNLFKPIHQLKADTSSMYPK